jgi:3-oxoadipate enol-lactonase
MQVQANGITFNAQIDGPEGAPWLVFSNSLATNLSMWDEQAKFFASRFRVLRYDQRGHGKTEAPAGRYSFDTLVADAIALFDALKIERAHFAGISMGGMTALGLAEFHGDRLLSVAPCDCTPNSTPASAQQWEERIEIAQKSGMADLVEVTVDRWVPPETKANAPAVADKVRGMIGSTPVNGYVGCAGALQNFDYRPGLGKIKQPVLMVVGAKDATLPGMRQLHADLPGSTLVELDGAGHLANLDQPDAFNRALDRFLGTA